MKLHYPSDDELYTPRTLDYDFVVEEFKAEFKLDVKRLTEIWRQYKLTPTAALVREWYHLYPEFDDVYGGIDIADFDIKELEKNPTALKPVYYLQSPKDKKTNPIFHYSLEEIMLSDLQEERNKNKRFMKQAYEAGDMDGFKRFNAMQLALKVIMNSTYGAAANAKFAHYDPDVAAAITWASRQCIKQLTDGLEGKVAYVDKEFLDNKYVSENMQGFSQVNMLKIEKVTDYSTITRRQALRRIYTDTYDIDTSKEIYKITKEPCEMVYQDTDSNYFECHAVQKHYLGCAPWSNDPKLSDESNFRCSPQILFEAMNAMVSLDNFLCELVVRTIDRVPIGLGFEGSFLICRYLNRKKKYFGVKAADDDGHVFTWLLCDDAYTEDGKLKPDYDKWWKPKNKCVPQSNGEFIKMDIEALLNGDINYLDFINSMGVKVTGVDLTRRDQYKFINLAHLFILQKDLRICYYDTNTLEWKGISLKEPIVNVVKSVIEDFRQSYNRIIDIANLRSDVKPNVAYRIGDFAKSTKYNGKDNAALACVTRYKQELKELYSTLATKYKISDDDWVDDKSLEMKVIKREIVGSFDESERETLNRIEGYIPYVGERLFYVITENEETREKTARGVKSLMQLTNLRVSIQELRDKIESEFGPDYFHAHVGSLNITYEEWLNAKMISCLYLKHYIKSLASALALYQIGERFPELAAEIDAGIYTDKEKAALVDKHQEIIAQEYVDMYFPRTKFKHTNYTAVNKKAVPTKTLLSNTTKRDKEIENIIRTLCPRINYRVQIIPLILLKNRSWVVSYKAHVDACDNIADNMRSQFSGFSFERGSVEEDIYKKYLMSSDAPFEKLTELRDNYLTKYQLCLRLKYLLEDI